MPPEEIWGHDELLSEWFDEVKIRRSPTDKSTERVPDPSDYADNELVREFMGR